MVLAFDTYYFDGRAKTVCVEFADWQAKTPSAVYSEVTDNVEEYVPGQFYKRELPCILGLLDKIDLVNVKTIIIDGYVYLDDEKSLGLGAHLYHALNGLVPVIGVAKSNFKTLNNHKSALLRGDSGNPLFISAIGINLIDATEKVRSMAGPYRIPTLLKTLDTLTRAV